MTSRSTWEPAGPRQRSPLPRDHPPMLGFGLGSELHAPGHSANRMLAFASKARWAPGGELGRLRGTASGARRTTDLRLLDGMIAEAVQVRELVAEPVDSGPYRSRRSPVKGAISGGTRGSPGPRTRATLLVRRLELPEAGTPVAPGAPLGPDLRPMPGPAISSTTSDVANLPGTGCAGRDLRHRRSAEPQPNFGPPGHAEIGSSRHARGAGRAWTGAAASRIWRGPAAWRSSCVAPDPTRPPSPDPDSRWPDDCAFLSGRWARPSEPKVS